MIVRALVVLVLLVGSLAAGGALVVGSALSGMTRAGAVLLQEEESREALARACTPGAAPPAASGVQPTSPDAQRFIAAIVEQESGGSYDAVGMEVRGDRAYGKYQIMGANVGPWSEQYLGRRVTAAEFRSSPAIQDAIAVAHLTNYFETYGARGAAAAWYSGNPNKHMDTRPQAGGAPSIKEYVDSIVGMMNGTAPLESAPAAGPVAAACTVGAAVGSAGSSDTAATSQFVPCASGQGQQVMGIRNPLTVCEVIPGMPLNSSFAPAVARLVAEAEAAGLKLGGSGGRSHQRQKELFAQNCPGGKGSCSPPTAVPGTSRHEDYAAADFTCNGVLIRSRTSPCFIFLARRGPQLGAFNLPSEPWHWSDNGN